jgi:4a-hydroxytetrahydrobiopterin dehydratase
MRVSEAAMKRLERDEARARLAELPAWNFDEGRGAVSRRFVFADFAQAFGFMTEVALAAERNDHHPNWTNVYNRVDVEWTTHDANGLTERDIAMAKATDAAFGRIAAKA